ERSHSPDVLGDKELTLRMTVNSRGSPSLVRGAGHGARAAARAPPNQDRPSPREAVIRIMEHYTYYMIRVRQPPGASRTDRLRGHAARLDTGEQPPFQRAAERLRFRTDGAGDRCNVSWPTNCSNT